MLPTEALQREFILHKTAITQSDKAVDDETLTAHGVILGGLGLLLPRDSINEVVEHKSVCKLPNTPSWFSGIVSLRGNMVPVFNMVELISSAPIKVNTTLLVIGQGEEAVAVWIDSLPIWKVLRKNNQLTNTPPLPDLLAEHVSTTYADEEQIWVNWNVSRFFSSLSTLI